MISESKLDCALFKMKKFGNQGKGICSIVDQTSGVFFFLGICSIVDQTGGGGGGDTRNTGTSERYHGKLPL